MPARVPLLREVRGRLGVRRVREAEVTIADGLNGLRIGSVQQGVHLTTLERTKPGDVFFVLGAPETVYMRYDGAKWSPDYPFTSMGDEVWYPISHVGDGDPRQRVLVLHNTRGE